MTRLCMRRATDYNITSRRPKKACGKKKNEERTKESKVKRGENKVKRGLTEVGGTGRHREGGLAEGDKGNEVSRIA